MVLIQYDVVVIDTTILQLGHLGWLEHGYTYFSECKINLVHNKPSHKMMVTHVRKGNYTYDIKKNKYILTNYLS